MDRFYYLVLFLILSGCGPIEPIVSLNCPGTLNIRNKNIPVVFAITSTFTPEEYVTITRAAQNWNEALGTNAIQFAEHGYPIIKVDRLEGRFQGVTRTKWINSYIIETRIEVSKEHLPWTDLESLMVHEFGHALGLGHVEGGVMAPYLNYGQKRTKIDNQSVDLIRCLYLNPLLGDDL